jgi:hypothetical protein
MLEFSVKCLRTRNRWVPHNNASQGLFRKADPARRLLPNGSLKVAFSPIVKRHPWLRENSADDIYGKNTIGGDEPVSVGGGGDAVFKGDENLYLSVFPEEPGLDENDEASYISFVIPSVKTSVPKWLPDLAEAVGGKALLRGAMEELSDKDRLEKITAVKMQVNAAGSRNRTGDLLITS